MASREEKAEEGPALEDKAARLARNLACSVLGEACACAVTCGPLCLLWTFVGADVVGLVSRGEYASALLFLVPVLGFLAALVAKWYLALHGARASNPTALHWYCVVNGVCVFPTGICTYILFVAGYLAAGIVPHSTYKDFLLASIPGWLALLLLFFLAKGAENAQTLRSHVLLQAPTSPPVVASRVDQAEKCLHGDGMKTGEQFCECADETKECV